MKHNIKRDSNGIAHVQALSGGKDSTALAIEFKRRHPEIPMNYVYTPTGDELPEMVAHIAFLQEYLGTEIIILTNGTLFSQIEQKACVPNFRMRWCTPALKLRPFGEFVEEVAPVIAYVGLRADEEDREGTRPGGESAAIGTACTILYPMREWGWTVDDVWACINQAGVVIPERTDCSLCFFQKLGEWYNLWKNHPDRWAKGEAIEEKYGHTFRSETRDSWPASLKELRAEFEKGRIPSRSLRMMETRKDMCRRCSL